MLRRSQRSYPKNLQFIKQSHDLTETPSKKTNKTQVPALVITSSTTHSIKIESNSTLNNTLCTYLLTFAQ